MRARYVVYWTADNGQEHNEICEGRGAFGKAQGLRHRMGQEGAYIVKEELRPVLVWQNVGLIEEHIVGLCSRSEPAAKRPKGRAGR
jgi:hypothetical protein